MKDFLQIFFGSIGVAVFIGVVSGFLWLNQMNFEMERSDMQMQIDFGYPDNPGYKGQMTSKDAAKKKKETKKHDQLQVLRALSASVNGLTADEVAGIYGEVFLKYHPRFSELRKLGVIEDTGDRRPSALGNNQIVWRVVNGK